MPAPCWQVGRQESAGGAEFSIGRAALARRKIPSIGSIWSFCRDGLGLAAALIWGSIVAAFLPFRDGKPAVPDPLAADLSEMLMLGFDGITPSAPLARILADQIGKGRVGGVIFVKANIKSRENIAALTALFQSRAPSKLLIAIDHEGGAVQRLGQHLGFTYVPPAQKVATTFSVAEAEKLYAKAAEEISAMGFNFNLAPVVDVYDPLNPPVGQEGRAFSSDPAAIVSYARAFIDGMRAHGVLSALKHFPGHGRALEDSHIDLPDITATWTEAEIEPYRTLMGEGRADAVLGGHLRLRTLEPSGLPTTLSPAVMRDLLRTKLGYEGVIITDDLDMSAIRDMMSRKQAVIRAIQAGNDILLIKNVYAFDANLPGTLLKWVREAIDDGTLKAETIVASAARVRRLKARLA